VVEEDEDDGCGLFIVITVFSFGMAGYCREPWLFPLYWGGLLLILHVASEVMKWLKK
jgi:hypothetical protein